MNDEVQNSVIEYDDSLENAEAPEPLPMQDYPATIMGAVIKTSASTGNRYIQVDCRISPDDYPADYPVDEAPDGKTLAYNFLSPEKTKKERYRMRKFCESVGIPLTAKLDLNTWIGMDINISVGHREWQGQTVEQVTGVVE